MVLAQAAFLWGFSGIVSGKNTQALHHPRKHTAFQDDLTSSGWGWCCGDAERSNKRHYDGQQFRQLHIQWIIERDVCSYSEPHGLHIQS